MTSKSRSLLLYGATPLLTAALMFWAAASYAPPGTPTAYAVATGLLTGCVLLAWLLLTPLLGRVSALAATCLLTAALFTVAALLAPGMCIDVVDGVAVVRGCTATDVLQWAAAGAVIPLVLAVLTIPVWLGIWLVRGVVRRHAPSRMKPGQ